MFRARTSCNWSRPHPAGRVLRGTSDSLIARLPPETCQRRSEGMWWLGWQADRHHSHTIRTRSPWKTTRRSPVCRRHIQRPLLFLGRAPPCSYRTQWPLARAVQSQHGSLCTDSSPPRTGRSLPDRRCTHSSRSRVRTSRPRIHRNGSDLLQQIGRFHSYS